MQRPALLSHGQQLTAAWGCWVQVQLQHAAQIRQVGAVLPGNLRHLLVACFALTQLGKYPARLLLQHRLNVGHAGAQGRAHGQAAVTDLQPDAASAAAHQPISHAGTAQGGGVRGFRVGKLQGAQA